MDISVKHIFIIYIMHFAVYLTHFLSLLSNASIPAQIAQNI